MFFYNNLHKSNSWNIKKHQVSSIKYRNNIISVNNKTLVSCWMVSSSLCIDLIPSLHPLTTRYLHITEAGIYILMFVIWLNNNSKSMETLVGRAFLLPTWLSHSLVWNRKRRRINMLQVVVNLLSYSGYVDIWFLYQ